MSEFWFRSYHGAPTDAKWVLIAKKAGTVPGVVASVWWALMDHASQAQPRGTVTSFDAESVAAFFGYKQTTVESVLEVLKTRGLIEEDGMLAAWKRRQPKREDLSTNRVRKLRERVFGDETQGNATERNETLEKSRVEQSRTDTEDKSSGVPPLVLVPPVVEKEESVHAQLMPIMRQLNYECDRTDGSILKVMARHIKPIDIEGAIRGLASMRDTGKLERMGITKGQKLNMRMLHADKGKAVRPLYREAEEEYWRNTPKAPKPHGMATLKDALRSAVNE